MKFFMLPHIFNLHSLSALALGAILGSFYNVLIYRLPRGTLWSSMRSHCPHCNALIPFWLNIPVVSWLLIRGRAVCCKKPISIQYPMVEIITALGTVAIYHYEPFLGQPSNISWPASFDGASFIRFLHIYIFASILWVSSIIDLHHKIIPNELSLGMIALSPLWMLIHPELKLVWSDALLGIFIGGGLPYSIAWLYWIIRKRHGLGMGDVKLLAGIGGWWGYQAILPTLLTASVTGSIVGLSLIALQRKLDMKREIPFGPFLALGALIYVFSQQNIIDLLFFPNSA